LFTLTAAENFQFIVLPHDQDTPDDEEIKAQKTRKVLLPGDATHDGLRAGGASEVLGDAHGAIYLLWSNHIHRIMFDSTKMSVNIQRFVRKMRYGRDPVSYRCLVWPSQMKGFQEASAKFEYPVRYIFFRRQIISRGIERGRQVEFQLPGSPHRWRGA